MKAYLLGVATPVALVAAWIGWAFLAAWWRHAPVFVHRRMLSAYLDSKHTDVTLRRRYRWFWACRWDSSIGTHRWVMLQYRPGRVLTAGYVRKHR